MLCKFLEVNPNNQLLFVFFNGFGSDYKYWDNLLPYFSQYNSVLLSENYFNHHEEHNFNSLKHIFEGKKIIGIGHSQGYHKLCVLNQKYNFFKLDKIVSLEGFSCYLGRSEPMKTIRKFYLDFMNYSYKLAPQLTLSNFMAMCGAPMQALPTNLNQELLLEDLQLLYSGIQPPQIPHLVLSSYDDWVIPFNIIEDNFRNLPDVKIIHTLGSGHLLGMKFPKYVSEQIQKFASL